MRLTNSHFINLNFLIFVMIIESNKIITSINKKDINKILVVNSLIVWGEIEFNIVLNNNTYLIPCYKIYLNYHNRQYVDVKLFKTYFYKNKLYSYYLIKRLVLDLDIIFITGKLDEPNYRVLQTIII